MKKKHWYILSISAVLIAFLTVLSVMSTAADKKPTPTVQKPTLTANKLTPSKPVLKPVEVSFAVSLDALAKQFPEKLAVYKTSPDSEGPRQKQVLIDKLGKSAAFETNDRSGGVFCGAMDRLWAKIPGPQDKVPRPDSKKITRAATDFLNSIKGMPKDKTTMVTSVDTVEFDQGGKRSNITLNMNVTWRRMVGNYSSVGPGGRVKVFTDMSGTPVGYLRTLRKLTLTGDQPIFSLKEAADKLKRNPLARIPLAGVKKVSVTGIRLGYYEHGINETQRYLQPVFVFDCAATSDLDNGKSEVKFVQYIEALKKPLEPIFDVGVDNKPGERATTPFKAGED